ncbi:DUF6702 family protein [Flavobacterium caeni]|uniref:Peptidase E n=1 Tax=Flavobacterium caeni TaxID=490189 RepID=A0A1G5I5X5_9FLAO|nr:DUF6702 family protein [Flavobacterium caeni]SCY71433.1 hypothetical protein SAMN02927903_02119 [Flavobacterium caeni]
MKKWLLIGLSVLLVSFAAHPFYVSIYQINFAPEKKMLQITSRIFVDDLNEALEKQYKTRTFLGDAKASAQDVVFFKQYLSDRMTVKVNGKPRAIEYVSHELQDNVVLGYFRVTDVAKVQSLEVHNTALFELFDDQQNIIQASVSGKKRNLLLTRDQKSGVLKWP